MTRETDGPLGISILTGNRRDTYAYAAGWAFA